MGRYEAIDTQTEATGAERHRRGFNIGWATTTNGGSTRSHGFLPGTTLVAGGRWGRLSDAAVAFDPKHGVWLISSLGIGGKAGTTGVLVSRSTQGGTVGNDPVTITVAAGRHHLDKDWIACDGTVVVPIDSNGTDLEAFVSADGGATWWATTTPRRSWAAWPCRCSQSPPRRLQAPSASP